MMASRMASARRARSASRAAGLSFLYVILILGIIAIFVAFAVDVGRIRVARSQLQSGADASARAGASGLPLSSRKDGVTPALTRAVDFGEKNVCLGDKIVVNQIADIDVGLWNKTSRTFTVLPGTAAVGGNAVRSTTRRLASRGNAVGLIFAPLVSAANKNATATYNEIETPAIAYITGGPTRNFAVVGLNYIDINGNGVTVAEYSPPSVADKEGASIASNGDIDVGNGNVLGDVRPGVNGSVDNGPNAQIAGWQAPLDTPLNGANGPYVALTDPPSPYVTVTMPKGNNKTPSGNGWVWADADHVAFTGGSSEDTAVNFYVDDNFTASEVKITGYIRLYVRGDFNMMGNSIVFVGGDNDPRRFKVFVLAGNYTVVVGGTPNLYMILNAPGADVTVNGTTQFWGSIVGKSVTMVGTINIHYPDYLATDITPFQIHLVK